MGSNCNLENELICILQRRYDGEMTIRGLVRFMCANGWLNPSHTLKVIIKDFYSQMLKHNRGDAKESRLDCMANYDVSDSYIQKLIYKNKQIK